jgi:thymidylate synthase
MADLLHEAPLGLDALLSRKDLIVGNPESNVGICTLWTQRALIAQRLDPNSYFICANLYSFAGINLIIRNIFSFPQIRYLVLCGADQSQTGEVLVELFSKGLGHHHTLPGVQARLDESIPLEAIEQLRQNVQLIDLRPVTTGLKNVEAITNRIKTELIDLPNLPAFTTPQSFPETLPEGGKALPSERSGFRVEATTVAATWLELLRLVMRFGEIKPTEYSQAQRELFNTVAVVTEEDPDDIKFEPWLPFSREQLENYYPQILSPVKPEGVSYTYGERLRHWGSGYDQIAQLKARLHEAIYTRRAVAVTWDVARDSSSDNPPCLVELTVGVQSEQLFLSVVFRSHDIFNAWPQNTYALRRLQKELAVEVGLSLGALTIISHSAHIYEGRWKLAQDLMTSFQSKHIEWKSDPRGYFVINVRRASATQPATICVQHSTLAGFTPYYFEGDSARQLCLEISRENLAGLAEHYAYLGRELMKAELALKLGLVYTQDKDLPL